MIQRAQKYKTLFPEGAIQYYHGDESKIQGSRKYDYVLCFYFLDLFRDDRIANVLDRIENVLKANGQILLADFYTNSKTSFFHRVLVKSMYLFFFVSSNIGTLKLGNFRTQISRRGFEQIFYHSQMNGLIQSEAFKKAGSSI